MLNRKQFIDRFRGPMGAWIHEVWCLRHASPSELGMLSDKLELDRNRLLGEMWDAVQPEPPTPISANGNGVHARRTP